MTEPKHQVIKLKTLTFHGSVSAPIRPVKKRVFTEDEWRFLNTLETVDLLGRIEQGAHLLRLLYNPRMLNMTQKEAAKISSNLRYQMDAIWSIINTKNKETDDGRPKSNERG